VIHHKGKDLNAEMAHATAIAFQVSGLVQGVASFAIFGTTKGAK